MCTSFAIHNIATKKKKYVMDGSYIIHTYRWFSSTYKQKYIPCHQLVVEVAIWEYFLDSLLSEQRSES